MLGFPKSTTVVLDENIAIAQASEAQIKQQAEQLSQTLQELKQAQTQLVQSEKMSSLGQLVAGVAHEINNPVNFIYGNIAHVHNYTQDLLALLQQYQQYDSILRVKFQELEEDLDIDFIVEDLPKVLSSMQMGVDRIREIVASLRTFSRLDEATCKVVNLHDGLESTLLILDHRLKIQPHRRAIAVIKQYDENLPKVECYAGQLNQVFMNLLANAIDAIEEQLDAHPQMQPQIKITTRFKHPNQVQIRIADNGGGIPESVQERLFDPFFTTKPIGKGTGLGLSISYQIVTETHRGHLQCFAEAGAGTEFVVTIPAQLAA